VLGQQRADGALVGGVNAGRDEPRIPRGGHHLLRTAEIPVGHHQVPDELPARRDGRHRATDTARPDQQDPHHRLRGHPITDSVAEPGCRAPIRGVDLTWRRS
jgi:hypothetical protein